MSKSKLVLRDSLGQQVVDHLREQIYNLELPPGANLNAVSISEELGVSRSPVRDALIMLAVEGLVEQSTGGGYKVIEFSRTLIHDVFTVRSALEPIALRQAIEHVPSTFWDNQIQFWSSIGEADTASSDFMQAYINHDNEFHEMIARSSSNKLLREFLDKIIHLSIAIRRWQHKQLVHIDQINSTSTEHLAVLETIKNGDVDASVSGLISHIENARQRVLTHASD